MATTRNDYLSMDLLPGDMGDKRDWIDLAICRGESVHVVRGNEYHANGEHYHGWPDMRVRLWTANVDERNLLGGVAVTRLHSDEIEEAVNECEDVPALLARIAAGHESAWDGHNHCGTLTDDAEAAIAELVEIINEALDDTPVYNREDTAWGWFAYDHDGSERHISDIGTDPGWTCVYWHDTAGVTTDVFGKADGHNDGSAQLRRILDDAGIPYEHDTNDDDDMVCVHMRDENIARARAAIERADRGYAKIITVNARHADGAYVLVWGDEDGRQMLTGELPLDIYTDCIIADDIDDSYETADMAREAVESVRRSLGIGSAPGEHWIA